MDVKQNGHSHAFHVDASAPAGLGSNGVPQHLEPSEEEVTACKVFVGGLAPTVDHSMLRQYCEAFGTVREAVVMIDKFTQRSRGFGFVTFDLPESVQRLMTDRDTEHLIDGKRVQFKRAVPASFSYNPEKIFVGGLPGTCDSEKLKEYFDKYGLVIDAQVMYDKSTGRSRGFGYVNYESADAVEAVLKDFHEHTIDGKWVEVKRCLPNDSRKNRGGMEGQMERSPGLMGGMSVPGYNPMAAIAAQYGYPGFYPRGNQPVNAYAAAMAAYMNPYFAGYDPYQAIAPQIASAAAAAYGMYPEYNGMDYAAFYGKGKGKGGGREDYPYDFPAQEGGSPSHAQQNQNLNVNQPHAAIGSPQTGCENPPMTDSGALDISAIFSQLNNS